MTVSDLYHFIMPFELVRNLFGCHSDCCEINTSVGMCFPQLNRTSGVYKIQPRFLNQSICVYCDMETSGGGWTEMTPSSS
ncbi:angiopoietin-4-like isoform X2 [Tachypleus tridentatus]|uniref:angiopoietin-4-like isoform X2 n=1 Tax=Tachypleus tridentatus TaxID=6853 RepID=UPI003FD4E1D5